MVGRHSDRHARREAAHVPVGGCRATKRRQDEQLPPANTGPAIKNDRGSPDGQPVGRSPIWARNGRVYERETAESVEEHDGPVGTDAAVHFILHELARDGEYASR